MDGTSDAPPKPFWKRKRWIAAAVLWLSLPVMYVLSTGPTLYLINRGWTPWEWSVAISMHTKFYRPVESIHIQPFDRLLTKWEFWWDDLAANHAVEEAVVSPK